MCSALRFFTGTLRKLTALGLLLATSISMAQEVCGIDSLFYNSFETTTSYPPLSSTPGALFSTGIAQSITGPGTFSASITYPASGATIGTTTTEVTGTFSGPTDTGIVVNGNIATVANGRFFVSDLALQPGSNTINVTATKLSGQTVAAPSISVTQTTSTSPLTLSIDRAAGFTPMQVTFTTGIGTLPNDGTVQSVAIDYNGDGTNDVTNPVAGTALTYLAQPAGLYTARLTVVDNHNVTYTAYRRYMVQDAKQQSGMLCDVYGYFKQRLVAADFNGALTAIHSNAQGEFQTLFNSTSASLPAYAANLGSIVNGTFDGSYGNFLIIRQNTDDTLSGFHMEFSRDAAGVWRISDM